MDASPAAVAELRSRGYPEEMLAPFRAKTVLELAVAVRDAMLSSKSEVAAVGVFWRSCLAAWKVVRRPRDLEPSDAHVIVQFLCDKTSNYPTAEESFEGLAAITEAYSGVLSGDTVRLIAGDWLPRANVQRQSTASRRSAFAVVDFLCRRRVADAFTAAAPFLAGFVRCCEAEQDPQNVLVAFQCNAALAAACDPVAITFHANDMFDVIAAYFPVLFTPSSDCPVTKAGLKEALHAAMASRAYDEFSLQFLSGKLNSLSAVTKADCLDVLSTILSRFETMIRSEDAAAVESTTTVLLPAMTDVLTALRSEVLKITAMGDEGDGGMLQGVLQALCLATQCVRHLPLDNLLSALSPIVSAAASTVESGSPSGRAYATMVHAVASASPFVCLAVTEYLAPLLCGIADSVTPTYPQIDGAVGVIAAVIASAERCFAQGLPVPPPRAPTLGMITRLIDRIARHCDETDRRITNFARCSAIEALATLCALGSCDANWFSPESSEVSMQFLIETAISVEARPGDSAKRAAKAAANAMRVATQLGARVAEAVLSSAVSRNRDRVLQLCDAMSETKLALPCRVAMLCVARNTPLECCGELALALRIAKRTATSSASAGSAGDLECATEWLCACASQPSGTLSMATRIASCLLRDAPSTAFAPLCSRLESVRSREVMIAAWPLSADAVAAIAETCGDLVAVARGSSSGGDAATWSPLAGMLLAHAPASNLLALGAELLALPTAQSHELAATLKATLIRSAESPATFEPFGRQLEEALSAATFASGDAASIASVLAEPFGPEDLGVASANTASWVHAYFGRCVRSLTAAVRGRGVRASVALAAARELVAVVSQEVAAPWCEGLLDLAFEALTSSETEAEAATLLSLLLAHAAENAIDRIVERPDLAIKLGDVGCTAAQMNARAACFSLLAEVGQFLGATAQRNPSIAMLAPRVAAASKKCLDDPKRVVRQAAAKARHYWMLLE